MVTPVKQLITQIRASQDAQALKQMEMASISRYLLGAYYEKATAQQRNEFSDLFQSFFAKIAFPKIRENFKNLLSITYEPSFINGNEATVASLVVIDHPLKNRR